MYPEVKKPTPSEKKDIALNSKEQAEQASGVGAAKDSNDAQKDYIKKPEPMYSEVKKPKLSEKKDEALVSIEQTKQVDEVGAAKDSNDSQKDDIKKPDPVNSEVKKPIPNEKKDEALDSIDQTELDLIMTENSKLDDNIEQVNNRSDGSSGMEPSSATLNDTDFKCEEDKKDELNYVELDLSQQSHHNSEIISKGGKWSMQK